MRLIVAPRFVGNEPFASISPIDTITDDGAGTNSPVTTPARTSTSSTPRIASHTKKKRADQRAGTAAGTAG